MISWLLVKHFLIIKLEETRFRITQWTNVLNVSSYYITKIGLLDKYKSNWKGRKHKTSNGPKACYFKWTSINIQHLCWVRAEKRQGDRFKILLLSFYVLAVQGVLQEFGYQYVISELSSLGTIHPLRKKNTALINAAWVRQGT